MGAQKNPKPMLQGASGRERGLESLWTVIIGKSGHSLRSRALAARVIAEHTLVNQHHG